MGATPAWASGGDTVPGSRYVSARGAALGDAFLPLTDDGAGGLFYNPAGLAKLEGSAIHFEPANFQLQANSELLNHFGTSIYKITSLSSYEPTLAASPGSFQGGSAALLPNFYFRDFAFGMLMQSRLAAEVVNGNVHYRSTYQMIPSAGFGLRLAQGIVRVGYSLQWVNQVSGDVTVPTTQSPLGYNQALGTGSGFSHTVGLALTLPYRLLPAFNVVARNVGNLHYTHASYFPLGQNTSGTLADEPMTFDASFSIRPMAGGGNYFNMVFEDRDATNRSGISIAGRLAAGIEYSLHNLFFLRGGWDSGYPSAGIGLKRPTAEFSVSWFSEELGTSYHQDRDTRFIVQYQIRAF